MLDTSQAGVALRLLCVTSRPLLHVPGPVFCLLVSSMLCQLAYLYLPTLCPSLEEKEVMTITAKMESPVKTELNSERSGGPGGFPAGALEGHQPTFLASSA